MGPTFNFKKKKVNKTKDLELIFTDRRSDGEREFQVFIFIFNFLSQIYGNLTVGFRRAKHEKCCTRRGLRVGTKNTGFRR